MAPVKLTAWMNDDHLWMEPDIWIEASPNESNSPSLDEIDLLKQKLYQWA